MSNQNSTFLADVERAKKVLRVKPNMSAKEVADALGLKSVLYAQTVKVYANAHKGA